MRFVVVVASLVSALSAQATLWQAIVPPSTTYFGTVTPFVDWDHDGHRDVLATALLDYATLQQRVVLQVLSGADGSAMHTALQPVLRSAVNAGDVDLDGAADVAILQDGLGVGGTWAIQIFSLATNSVLWTNSGPNGMGYGFAMLGDLDVDGDGARDFLTITSHPSDSRVFVYDNSGATLYTVQISGVYGVAISLANLGDRNNDGCDDFLVGVNDFSTRGMILLVSGANGAILRTTMGLLPGDKTCDFVSNFGDLDGDGVPDYAGFPWLSAQRAMVPVWSGQTGALIRTWDEFANSVIVGEDLDQDAVPDLVIGADWDVTGTPPYRYGRTTAYSGRDGAELWRVENLPIMSGSAGSNSGGGWMDSAAAIGPTLGNPYPTVAWLDRNYAVPGAPSGRVRAFRTPFVGQGPVTGAPCSTTSTTPLIGVRRAPLALPPAPQQARITIANASPGAAAWLNLDYANATSFGGVPLPVSLAAVGLPQCLVHVGPTAFVFRTLGTIGLDRGYAHVDMPRPLTATLGTAIAAQWLVFDPTTFDFAASQRHQLRLQ
jgi:hypothetical protein